MSSTGNLCGIGAPGASTTSDTDDSNLVTAKCSDCVTVSGVVVGTVVPSTFTDPTASFLDDTNNKRAQLTAVPRQTLLPRAPKAVPLAEPDPKDQENFMLGIKDSIEFTSGNNIGIFPTERQLQKWTIPLQINGKTVNTPIGVTGVWYPWPNSAQNYKIVGMSGCTAVLIVGNLGFWAGHFWEASKPGNINGGSSFNYRYGNGAGEEVERSVADFKTIAADVLGKPAPADLGSFISLLDLQTSKGDPFGRDNGGGDVYIITKAAGTSAAQQKKQRYQDKISALTTAIRKYVRPNTITVRTYIGDSSTFTGNPAVSPAGVPKTLNGVTIMQYSPYAGKSNKGCPEARARVWEELDTSPAVDRKWASTLAGLKKRDGAACALPSSASSSAAAAPASTKSSTAAEVTTPTKSSTAAIATTRPCYVKEDPDQKQGASCVCSNGHTIPIVTTTNSAGAVDNCPWPTIPPQALTTSKVTNDKQYLYTYTDISKKVIECQTFTKNNFGGAEASFCVGSTAVLYEPPLATMEMGSSKVNVGTTMTGEVLYTSISNALTSLCPTPTSSGAWTSCQTGTVKVGQAAYLESGQPEEGEVTLHVTDAQYNSTDYLNLFINMIAGSANASATGKNCKPLDWSYVTDNVKRDVDGRAVGPPEPVQHKGTSTFCNLNSFLDTQWYDGIQESAQMWFETEFGFAAGELGDFDCVGSVDVVAEVLGAIFDAIFPEFAWLINTGVVLGELACEAAEIFNPTRSKRDIEQDKVDAKLARAWQKEVKKDRKLPMPEHKKRELGIID
ncbi:hypothetical protein LSUB1_G002573 [Lachnellula subtilissima]|uniref:Uncharacterized protein n=1 Tax=Lachnellula subtilissima TaxID=602034 RepID=A0A8H8UAB3_9HELO|nr:hypothetical protein LSUB1_G002573 [Lachnellula subtilissima]